MIGERLVTLEENRYLESGDTEAYKYLFVKGRRVNKTSKVWPMATLSHLNYVISSQ